MDVDTRSDDESEDLPSCHDSENNSLDDFIPAVQFKFHGNGVDLAVFTQCFEWKLVWTATSLCFTANRVEDLTIRRVIFVSVSAEKRRTIKDYGYTCVDASVQRENQPEDSESAERFYIRREENCFHFSSINAINELGEREGIRSKVLSCPRVFGETG